MIRRLATCAVAFAVAALGLAGCSSAHPDTGKHAHTTAAMPLDPIPLAGPVAPVLPVTVRGFDGVSATVTDVNRIIGVDRYGTLTQIAYTLGFGDRLVARSSSAGFPAARHLPNVARGGAMNVEAVLALHPSVLLTDAITTTPTMAQQLRGAGVKLVFFDPARTLAGVGPQIRAVADTLGVHDRGMALAQRTEAEIAAAIKGPFPTSKPRIAFLFLRSTAITMMGGPKSGAHALIEAIGAVDAGAGLHGDFVPITSEAMVAAAPDIFLVMTNGLSSIGGEIGLMKLPGVAQTPAGRNSRIVDMADTVLLGFGPNTGRVLTAVSAAVYGTPSPR